MINVAPVRGGCLRDEMRSISRSCVSENPYLRGKLSTCRGALIGIGLFSATINILYLTGPLYMLQIYDRVIPSRSVPTLVALSVLAGLLFAVQALLDVFRT